MASAFFHKIRDRAKNIQDSLIAAGIVLLTAGLVSQISKWLRRGASDFSSNAIGIAAGILVLAWFARERVRAAFGPPKPKGDRLAIYVARFAHDKDSKTLQHQIEATILEDYGDTLQVRRATLPRPPASAEDPETEAKTVAAGARALLEGTGGDLVIWGELADVGRGACTVHFVSMDDEGIEGKRFEFRKGALLEGEFAAGLGAAIAARAEVLSGFAHERQGGQRIVEVLLEAVRRFERLLNHVPECVRPMERGRLFCSVGLVFDVIGERSGENPPIERAVQLFEAALECFPRDQFAKEWGRLKLHVGRSLASLGQRRLDTAGLQAAAESFGAAIEVADQTGHRQLAAEARFLLGSVQAALGWRTREPEMVRRGIRTIEESIVLLDPDLDTVRWADAHYQLGESYHQLAQLEGGTECLKLAIRAHELALTRLTVEGDRRVWAKTKLGLTHVSALLGLRENDPGKLRHAIDDYRGTLRAAVPFPLLWAQVQMRLGIALNYLSRFETPEEHLKAAVAAYELALGTDLTRERDAFNWPRTQFDLGLALAQLGDLQQDTMAYERAEVAVRKALDAWPSGPDHDRGIELLAYVSKRIKDRRSGLP